MVSSTTKLFKGTYAWHVTSNLVHMILGLDGKVPRSSSSNRSFEVSEVDFFICHSWSCPATLKALAVCHQLNLNLAIATSIFACLFLIFTIVLCGGPHVSTYSRWLTLCPIGVFMTTYLFGHFINKKTFWFDRISVDQGNLLLKSQTLSEIPTFIARSSTLMVLWDDTLFDRLWCNFELAVRAKVAPNNSIQIVPSWMPVWTLTWFCVNTRMCSVADFPPFPHPGETESRLSTVISYVETWTGPVYLYFLAALIISSAGLEKTKRHKSMLDRMASFEFRNAKCALETDRIVIEEQIFRLFDEALEPAVSIDLDDLGTAIPAPGPLETQMPLISPDTLHDIRHITSYPTKDEVIEQFNSYVRGPLRNIALSSTGPPGHLSFELCCAAQLPWQAAMLCRILTCEMQSNCEAYVSEIGYSSVAQYMAMNAVTALFLSNYSSVIFVPLMLRGNEVIAEVIDGPMLKRLIGAFLGTIILCTLDYFAQAQSGMFCVVCTKYSPLWLAGFLVGLTMQIAALWAMFFRAPTSSSLRCLAPSKVLTWSYAQWKVGQTLGMGFVGSFWQLWSMKFGHWLCFWCLSTAIFDFNCNWILDIGNRILILGNVMKYEVFNRIAY